MNMEDIRKLRYLLVDDEPFALTLNRRMLNKLGCEDITTANDGTEAITRITTADSPYDIVICDLNMPGMDGVEFMRHAAQKNFDGGIIYLSGEDERMLESAYELGKAHKLNILGVLSKPVKPGLLQQTLARFEKTGAREDRISPNRLSEKEFREGLEAGGRELLLTYQPKVDIRTGKIVSVETLARWQHPERGILGSHEFIPLAEETGLIHDLTMLIYAGAVRQSAQWLMEGMTLNTAVNFSIASFNNPGLVDFISDTAAGEGLDPKHITLEITESQVMEDMANCLEVMMRMRLKRFHLSIDDFGTGHSSLTQLRNIPFTELKIDKAFVHNAANNSASRAILESSLDLARKLDMKTVAEGVETREDWNLVEQLGCDYVQGYYCAKPMANEAFMDFMGRWNGPH